MRLAAAAALLCATSRALAADGLVSCELEARAGRLAARVDLGFAFPDELKRTFGNGLTHTVALHAALLRDGEDEPAALYVRVVEVLYDVWDESWVVVTKDPQAPRGRRQTARSWEELRALLADARDLDLGPVAAVAEGVWTVRVRVEVDPVSRELVERTREYIANPPGGPRGAPPSRSVLGATAGFLLQAASTGDARLARGRPFTIREVRGR